MTFKTNTKAKLRSVFGITIFGMIVGPLFVCTAFGFDVERAIKGFVAGFLITFLGGVFEKIIYPSKVKKMNFSLVLLVRTLVYIFVITFSVTMVWVIHESIINSRGIIATTLSDDFIHFMTKGDFPYIFIFAITTSFLVNFLFQLNDLLGRRILLSYLTGKYHRPKIEERFFMFLDLESSTTIAETIGPVKYHNFMNSYFYDLNGPITESKGEIYQYVGDEVVISWKKQNGIKNTNCIGCYYKIKEILDGLHDKYIKEFGLVPGFKAGVHFGEVVIGEIGDSKKDIVFHGDVMNTASRVQAQAKVMNKQLLISSEALSKLNLDGKYEVENVGKFKLKGKELETEIYSVVCL